MTVWKVSKIWIKFFQVLLSTFKLLLFVDFIVKDRHGGGAKPNLLFDVPNLSLLIHIIISVRVSARVFVVKRNDVYENLFFKLTISLQWIKKYFVQFNLQRCYFPIVLFKTNDVRRNFGDSMFFFLFSLWFYVAYTSV